jgi:uncharacterized protein (DUF2235 family)
MSEIVAPQNNPSPKNIILLSDGTGNSSAKIFKTNVWRLFQALDLKRPEKQVAYYDNGVGTSSLKWWAAITGVFGIGLHRNVVDIYSFCCRNYNRGDKIYGFGFSRGSFTIRVVAGVIARVGLVEYDGDESHLAAQAQAAYREYRRHFNTKTYVEVPLRWLRDLFVTALDKNKVVQVDKIQFLGLWDTVDAYGGPIEEITRAIDYWYWPLSMPDRFMRAKVHRACHALSLDDARDAFRPVIWDERYVWWDDERLHEIDRDWKADVSPEFKDKLTPIDNKRLSQVWFVGVHCDIGGGYPQDGLSYVTLDWMIDRAKPFGLLLNPLQLDLLKPLVDPYDKLNDSRHGFGGYYRYRPRNIQEIYNAPPYKPSIKADIEYMFGELIGNVNTQRSVERDLAKGVRFVQPPPATIHEAVFKRISATLKVEPAPPFKVATDGYAPIVLPAAYHVTNKDGALSLNNDPIDPQPPRIVQTQLVWNLVWGRRIVYFLTVFVFLALASVPLMQDPTLGADTPLALLRPLIALAAAFLPAFLAPWFEAYSAAPGWLALYGVLLVGLLLIGGWLQKKIVDVERAIWIRRPVKAGFFDSIAHIRTRAGYRIFFYWLKHEGLPSLFALLILLTIIAVASQVVFRAQDSFGAFCVNSATSTAAGPVKKEISFDTKDICKATQLTVAKGEEYRVTITATPDWSDDGRIATDPKGYNWKKGMFWTSVGKVLHAPFRRVVFSRWLVPVLRVGNKGDDEVVLDLKQVPAKPEKAGTYEAKFTPRSAGEVFVFVNDAMYLWGNGYDNNVGSATITIEHLEPVR